MSIKRAGTIASLVMMLFLLTGGYYVQVLEIIRESENRKPVYFSFIS